MSGSRLHRRQVLIGLSASLGVLSLRGFAVEAASKVHFTHGVASGDPLSDRVILWTRVIPGAGQHQQVNVKWQVAKDVDFGQIVSEGLAMASQETDYTLKVDADGLQPGQGYYYRFMSAEVTSDVGRTRTLPVGKVDQYRVGVASCSNYPQGYFNAYQHMAATDLDLVLHLGDYIYEYAEGIYASPVALKELGRHVQPDHEILSLEDYRMRYGLYRTDPDLQAVHARHPFVCVWDDHELANNTWQSGAQNHSDDEGSFTQRMQQARRAYHEWLPIRTTEMGDQAPIYRHFEIGELADLLMLDTRLHGRDRGLVYEKDMKMAQIHYDVTDSNNPIEVNELPSGAANQLATIEHYDLPYDMRGAKAVAMRDYQLVKGLTAETLPEDWAYLPDTEAFRARLLDPTRTMLGLDQEQWLAAQLQKSKARGVPWQILGQQVLVGKVGMPTFNEEQWPRGNMPDRLTSFLKRLQDLAGEQLPFNLDAWDGYPAARQRLFADLQAHAMNPVMLAGDTHNAWMFDLKDELGHAVGVEFGTPGITSPGLESYLPLPTAAVAEALRAASPEIVDLDTSRRGWTELTLTPQAVSGQWHFVDNILRRSFAVQSTTEQVCRVDTRAFANRDS
jgi:alkaline phosphatase D